MRFFYLVIFLGLSNLSSAQISGFIVTNDNDTIKGFFKSKNELDFYDKVIFTRKGESKSVKYQANDIKAFRKYKDNFVSKQLASWNAVNGGYYFCKVLEKGKITLYDNVSTSQVGTGSGIATPVNTKRLYLEKDGNFQYASRKAEELLQFFGDNEEIRNTISTSKSKDLDIRALVKKYNSSID